MLACALFEGVGRSLLAECDPEAIEESRARRFGRWELAGPLPAGDALLGSAEHFKRPRSALLFEPPTEKGEGGLGAPPSALLLAHGIISLGCVCAPPVRGSGMQGTFIASLAEFRSRVPGFPEGRRAERAVLGLVEWLRDRGVDPCKPERPRCFLDPRRSAPARFGLGMQGTLHGHTAQAGGVAREDPSEWRELARDLHAERALDRSQQRPKSYWDERLRAVVRGVDGSSAREWVTGMPVAASMACGPRVGVMLDEDRALAVSGGEGRFMLRGDEARASEFAWALGEDGFREGWCERAAQFRSLVSFGEGGVPFDGDTGLPLESADLAALPPAVQLECRARAELGDVEVLAISAGKRAGTHVSLDVQLENHRELCELQAKFDFTAAYTTDAGTGLSRCEDTVLRDGMGNPIPCVSQAAGRHDGVVCSGTIEATRGLDNYVGEMAALLLAITDAAEGGRVLVVLDASSPVRAWLRFRGRHNRHKLDYYAARLLDSLDQALQKLEVVVFFWQTSHVGSPTNE